MYNGGIGYSAQGANLVAAPIAIGLCNPVIGGFVAVNALIQHLKPTATWGEEEAILSETEKGAKDAIN